MTPDDADPWRPLAGLRVLEVSGTAIGGYAGRLFRELGADVVLTEQPGTLGEVRGAGPFPSGLPGANDGRLHRYLNAGKRGLSLRIEHVDGSAVLQRLAAAADLVIHELPASEAEEHGLRYSRLATVAPRLVVLSLAPFGQGGPYAQWKATENVLFAMSGRMILQGDPVREPLAYGPGLVASQVATTAAGAAMAAIFAAAETGQGTEVDVAGVEAQLANADHFFHFWSLGGYDAPRGLFPPNTYPCADGFMLIGALGQRYLAGMGDFVGFPGIEQDPRFSSPNAVAENQDAFDAILLPHVVDRPRDEVVRELQARGVLCTPVIAPGEAPDDAQYRARSFFQPLDVDDRESRTPGPPFRLAQDVAPPVPPRAPVPGEHTEEVLRDWLALSAHEIERLALLGVLG